MANRVPRSYIITVTKKIRSNVVDVSSSTIQATSWKAAFRTFIAKFDMDMKGKEVTEALTYFAPSQDKSSWFAVFENFDCMVIKVL